MQHFVLKIPNKQKLQKMHLIINQILTLETYESLQKMYSKIILFFSYDATLASDNPSRLRKNIL